MAPVWGEGGLYLEAVAGANLYVCMFMHTLRKVNVHVCVFESEYESMR